MHNGLTFNNSPPTLMTKMEPEKQIRKINKRPYKILEAENL